jgi:hypothetical protein
MDSLNVDKAKFGQYSLQFLAEMCFAVLPNGNNVLHVFNVTRSLVNLEKKFRDF